VERAEILIDAQGDPHPFDAPLGRVAVVGLRSEQDPVQSRLGDADQHLRLADVKQPLEYAVTSPRQPVEAAAQRERERPARADVNPHNVVSDHSWGLIR